MRERGRWTVREGVRERESERRERGRWREKEREIDGDDDSGVNSAPGYF